uniref:Uncharacterized protein n=1 Tax=Vitis vinifera TaxID=29760 RepID=F6HZX1_VITVI
MDDEPLCFTYTLIFSKNYLVFDVTLLNTIFNGHYECLAGLAIPNKIPKCPLTRYANLS